MIWHAHRSFLAAILALLVSLSGCVSFDEGAETSESPTPEDGMGGDGDGDASGGDDEEGSPSPGGGPNRPPIADIVVMDETGAELTEENGSIATTAGTNLTFDGSDSNDPDAEGDLSFVWDFGDGSVGSNATETHVFEAGEFNVTLMVTDSGGASGSAEVVLNLTPAGPIFVDDAESGNASWTFSSTGNEEAAGWHETEAEASSGSMAFTHIDEEDVEGYRNEENVTMVSVPIDLTAETEATLTFQAMGASEEEFDFLYWEISTDGGATWEELGSLTGEIEDWEEQEADLSEFTGTTVQIRFRFTSDDTCSDEDSGLLDANPVCTFLSGPYGGWYLDDVKVDRPEATA